MSDLLSKIRDRIENINERKYFVATIPSIGEKLELESLILPELIDIQNVKSNDPYAADRYCIYLACPALREVAKKLKEAGMIDEYTDVCKGFKAGELRILSSKILELSGGVFEKSKIEFEIKN